MTILRAVVFAYDIGHRSQLAPGAGIEHDQHVALQVGVGHVAAENLHVVVRVDERDVRRHGIAIYDSHRFAERTQCER